jgi:hypothetical protein
MSPNNNVIVLYVDLNHANVSKKTICSHGAATSFPVSENKNILLFMYFSSPTADMLDELVTFIHTPGSVNIAKPTETEIFNVLLKAF